MHLLALVSLSVAGACATANKAPTSTAATRPAVTEPATTSTTQPPVQPLTGLLAGPNLGRPALSVKIDNVDEARPQSGLNAADLVVEELVEGGQTRLFATYHSQDAPLVGPIRSARPVDADLLRQLAGGIFAYSGAATGEIAPVIDHSTSVLLSDDGRDPGFHRSRSKRAPHNLFGSTSGFYDVGTKRGGVGLRPPPRLFDYDASAPAGSPATSVGLTMGSRTTASWAFDQPSHQWRRTQNGRPDVLDDGSPVTADNVLVLSVTIAGTGILDAAGEEDPLVVVTGSGDAALFRDGMVRQGTWQRPTFTDQMKLSPAAGPPLALRPGRTWIELQPVPGKPVVSP